MLKAWRFIQTLQVSPWLWVSALICLPILILSFYGDHKRINEALLSKNASMMQGHLDTLNGDLKVGNQIVVSGWAASSVLDQPVQKVEVLINETPIQMAQLGFRRSDVAQATQYAHFINSGWVATFTLPLLEPRVYNVTAIAYDTQNNKTILSGSKTIKLAP